MASLISATEKAVLTGIFGDIFDTFSRNITIHKEPLKTFRTVDTSNLMYGYGENQLEEQFDYTPVSGVYPAIIRYGTQKITRGDEINVYFPDSEVTIKVKKEARDFINSGETPKITFDDREFTIDAEEKKQTFLDSQFYRFKLKSVK